MTRHDEDSTTQPGTDSTTRRSVLRNSAIVSGGLALGVTGTAGARGGGQNSNQNQNGGGRGQGGVGYISESSFDYLSDEDCYDGVFYITERVDQTLDARPSCQGGGPKQTFQGYKIHSKPETGCSTSACDCSWIFLNSSRNVKTLADGDEIRQRVTNVHNDDGICHEGDEVGGQTFPVVRVTFAPDRP